MLHEGGLDFAASIGDLNAISIFPQSAPTPWEFNTGQQWQDVLTVRIWTRNWDLRTPEDLLQKVIEAAFKDDAYTIMNTGGHPPEIGTPSFRPIAIAKSPVMLTTMTVTIPTSWIPVTT